MSRVALGFLWAALLLPGCVGSSPVMEDLSLRVTGMVKAQGIT